jgi:hypothetical protein
MLQAAPACTLRTMQDGRSCIHRGAVTEKPKAAAEVHILVVKEIAFVESTCLPAANKHEHAGDPIRFVHTAQSALVGTALS